MFCVVVGIFSCLIPVLCPEIFLCRKKIKKIVKNITKNKKILHIRYVRDKACGAGAVTAVLHQRMLAYRWEYGRYRNADT